MALESMALLLNLWYKLISLWYIRRSLELPRRAALILGIQYLTFQAFPIIFEDGHHFNVQSTGMSFIGMGLGLLLGLACQPIINMSVLVEFLTCHAIDPHILQLLAQAEDQV